MFLDKFFEDLLQFIIQLIIQPGSGQGLGWDEAGGILNFLSKNDSAAFEI